jgi:competence protein ComEC
MITGIMSGNVTSHAHLLLAVLCFAVLAALFLAGFFYRGWLVFWICLLAGIWSGYQSFYLHSPRLLPGHVTHFYNDPDIRVVGRIVSFSRKYPHKIRVVLDCRKIVTTHSATDTQAVTATGRLYLNVYGKTDHSLKFHDLIQCPGPIRPIRNFGNPGAFDYQTFLKRQGIFGAVHTGADKIIMVSEEKSFLLLRWLQGLENIRDRFYNFAMTRLDHRDPAYVLAALVTGKKLQMPAQIKDLFARSGASHLLAISGLHLGILSVIFYYFFIGYCHVFHAC